METHSKTFNRKFRLAVLIGALVLGAGFPEVKAAEMCTADTPDEVLRLGVRADAAPFSYKGDVADRATKLGNSDLYSGYTVNLCTEFAVKRARNGPGSYCFVEVDPENRFSRLQGDEVAPGDVIDILCGATTATLEVRNRFEPSLYTFLTVNTFLYNPSKTDGVVRFGVLVGTTSDDFERSWEETPDFLNRHFADAEKQLVRLESHDDAAKKLAEGKIDVYVADRPILTRIAEDLGSDSNLRIHEDAIEVQPYAVMFRKKPLSARADVQKGLSFKFNRFLIETKFRREEFSKFTETLVREFGSDLDRSFLRLARIQGAIPIGGVPADTE